MSRKNKNRINEKQAKEILRQGYELNVDVMNFYQFRIYSEEHKNIFFDWYHTTGSLVVNENGDNKSLGKIKDPEDLAIFIQKYYDR